MAVPENRRKSPSPEFPLRVFFDGSCSVCAREIEMYRVKDREGKLRCIDISAPDFEPEQYSIPQEDFMKLMHAIDARGVVYRGVESFWAIWQAFPSSTLFGLLGTLISLPLINPLARVCYGSFSNIRQYLPKRTTTCTSGACEIKKGKHK